MKKMRRVIVGLLLSLAFSSAIFAQETSLPDSAKFQFPIMQPDPVTLQKWIKKYQNGTQG